MKIDGWKMVFVLIALILFISHIPAFPQKIKYEKENRINKEDFPEKALTLLDSVLKKARKIRFYSETNLETKGFECKFKLNKKRFSVEFTGDGKLEDVEFLFDMKRMPEHTRSAIYDHLRENYKKLRLRRIQKQYSGLDTRLSDKEILTRALRSDERNMLIRYELELDGLQENDLVSHELLFGENGKLLQKRTIIDRQVDNILY